MSIDLLYAKFINSKVINLVAKRMPVVVLPTVFDYVQVRTWTCFVFV